MGKQTSKPDGRTVELARAGILNLNTGTIDRNKALKHGLVPPMKQKSHGGKKK